MAKQGSRAEVNTFVKGLITEASPLNFPANASLDEVNFELKRDGTRRRRLGMAVEPGSMNRALPNASSTRNTYVWTGVNGNYSTEFLVVQIGNVLQFFNVAFTPLINNFLGSVTLSFSPDVLYSFTSTNGKLIVAGKGVFVYSIEYTGSAFTATERTLKVRDVWGITESHAPTEADDTYQPSALTFTHEYNLQNQSWGIPRKDKVGATVDPVAYYNTDLGRFPSSSETVWSGLQFQPVETNRTETPGAATNTSAIDGSSPGSATSTTVVDVSTGDYTTTTTVDPVGPGSLAEGTITYAPPSVSIVYNDPYERMFNTLYVDRLGANLKAAKGYYIIELLNRGASRQAAVNANHAKYSQIPTATIPRGDYNSTGAAIVCEFAGRIFYSGFDGVVTDGDSRSPSLANYVVFSKLVENDLDIDRCYQEGDPTSRESNEIVDTDGGFISVVGARQIVGMYNLGSKLIILASNGVWSLTGGNDYGFTATNYKVDKLSTFGCLSSESVVIEGSTMLFWGKNGIYGIVPNQVGGFGVEDVTATTIQTLYNSIPDSGKASSQGEYDPVEKKMRWVYRYNSVCKELIFDTVLKCFYQHQIDTSQSQVVSLFYSTLMNTPIKYLTINNGTYAFSTYNNAQFLDWGVVDAKGYLLTGATTAGDSAIDKQVPYVTVHMLRTETGTDSEGVPLNQSSCLMCGRWEWANSVISHQISGLHEVYKYRLPQFTLPNSTYDNGFQTIISKNKLRGKGKALSLYFETSPAKDCVLLGWSITLNGNAIT